MQSIHAKSILQTIAKSAWKKDSQCDECNVCRQSIYRGWMRSNKHHCRYCGNIVCESCSKNTVFDDTNRAPHRICDVCCQDDCNSDSKQIIEPDCNATHHHDADSRPPGQPQPKTRSMAVAVPPTAVKSHRHSSLSISSAYPCEKTAPVPLPRRCNTFPMDKKTHYKLAMNIWDARPPLSRRKMSQTVDNKYWVNCRSLLVFGYLRAESIALPSALAHIIVSCIFLNDAWQQFDNVSNADRMLISNASQTIERITHNIRHCYYAFGSHVVSAGTRKRWRLRIDAIEYYTNNHCSMLVGVVEASKMQWVRTLLGDFTYGAYKGYALRIARDTCFVHQHVTKNIHLQTGFLRKGHIIHVDLDLRSDDAKYGLLRYKFEDECGANISYGLNAQLKWLGARKCVAFDKIDKKKSWILVVGLCCKNKLTFLEPSPFKLNL